ncbi:hypothetical protein C1N62_21115 (plasmid) [Nissabacter sp. SGAir0207]|nr:hypothetical protein C1N62_21115 [Nissabacter sp. SGAir0207]
MGIGAALGMMSKGLLGPGLLYLSAALCLFILGSYRKKSFINSILIALAVTMLLSFPWILALWHRSPELLHLWFWDNNLGRFLGTNNLGPKKGHLFYLYTLSWYAFPALPMCLLYFLTKNRKVLRDGISVSLIFFMVTFFTLSLSSDARELYALPLLLPLSVIAAAAVPISVIPSFSSFLKGLSFSLILFLIFIGLLVNLPFAFSPLREFVNYFVPGYDSDINPLLVIISLAAPLAVLIVIMKTDSSKTPTVFYFSCLMTIIWSIIMTLGLPLIDYSKRYSDVFSQINMIVPKGECVISQGLGEPQRAMLHYYTGIKTSRVENGSLNESCHYLLRQGKTTTEKKSFHDLIWSGSRPGEEDEFYEVFKTH